MARIETLLGEIKKLNYKELEMIFRAVRKRMEQRKKAALALDSFIGIGKGIWETDAQQYIDAIRDEDRL
jgi:hypothetical protein